MRRSCAALATLLGVAVLAGFAPPASAAPVTYVAPVSGTVTDPFRPPSSKYGAGNRGLQYATTPGSPAWASAPGRVTFAGQVGGALHVVIQHDDGVRTSYSFLRTIKTRAGQVVAQNDTIGTTADSFHFGARIGDAYVDPAILIESGPTRVHLVPDGEFEEEGAHDDRSSLARAVLDHFGSIGGGAYNWAKAGGRAALLSPVELSAVLIRVGDEAIELGGRAAGAARNELIRIGHDLKVFAGQVRDGAVQLIAPKLIGLLDRIVNMGQFGGAFASLAAALADVVEAWVEACTPEDDPAPPMQDRHNRVAVFVAGLGSKSRGPHTKGNLSRELDAEALGYARGNTYDFSYRGGQLPYTSRDTTGDLRDDARELRELLAEIARAHPGAHVDLIAHSQGGLIAREALAHDYDGPGHELPPVDHLITLATPHHGADSATTLAWMRFSIEGQAIRAIAKEKMNSFDATGPGVAQLAETSDFIERINDRALREGVAYTSITSATDFTVPAVRARLAGARNVIVDAAPANPVTGSHSTIKQSESAKREVRLALADAPPTCQPVWKTATRAFTGAAVATAEDATSVLVP